jgi:hypothetical protein
MINSHYKRINVFTRLSHMSEYYKMLLQENISKTSIRCEQVLLMQQRRIYSLMVETYKE